LTQSADNSGVLQLASGTGNLVTVPSVTGTAMVSGNIPTFYAYQSASPQSLSGGAVTKITLDAELFDTNNNFASSTFTPTVAGYYSLTALVTVGASNQEIVAYIRKNGSGVINGMDIVTGSYNSMVTGIQYANGTTDYFDIYCYVSSTRSVSNVLSNTYFTGSLVRTA
jgi:hypothetical protein